MPPSQRQGFGPQPDMFAFGLLMFSGAIVLFHLLPWLWAMVVAMPLVACAWLVMCIAAHYAGFALLCPGVLLAGVTMLVRPHPPWVVFAAIPLLLLGGLGSLILLAVLVNDRMSPPKS